MILKIFTDVDLRINMSISKWIICKHNFSLLLLTLNIHFQIGKCIPRDTCPCTLVCEPLGLWLEVRPRQMWATATLKIASLLLSPFAENKAPLLLWLLNKNSSKLSLPLRLVNFWISFCFAEVGFIFQPHLETFSKLLILLGAPFLKKQDLQTIVIEPLWLGIAHFAANTHITGT